jgi:hypothetical protein
MRPLTHRPPRSFTKYVLFVLTVGLVAALATFGAAGIVGAQDQVCPDLDTGKIDPAGDPTSLVITAPPGQVIVQVCVKAGSENQGLGPEFTDFNPGVTQTTISHTSGKEISHYSVKFADAPPPPNGTAPPNGTVPPPEVKQPPPGPAAAQAGRPAAPGVTPAPGAAAAVVAQPRTTG